MEEKPARVCTPSQHFRRQAPDEGGGEGMEGSQLGRCTVNVCSATVAKVYLTCGTGVSYRPRGKSPVICISFLTLASHTESL